MHKTRLAMSIERVRVIMRINEVSWPSTREYMRDKIKDDGEAADRMALNVALVHFGNFEFEPVPGMPRYFTTRMDCEHVLTEDTIDHILTRIYTLHPDTVVKVEIVPRALWNHLRAPEINTPTV